MTPDPIVPLSLVTKGLTPKLTIQPALRKAGLTLKASTPSTHHHQEGIARPTAEPRSRAT